MVWRSLHFYKSLRRSPPVSHEKESRKEGRNHAGMRLRRYSRTASVPLATMAPLGARKGFPSRLRFLGATEGFTWIQVFTANHTRADRSSSTGYLRLLHRPSSGGTLSRSLLDRSNVDRRTSLIRRLGSTPPTWLLPSNTVSRETTS